MKLPFGRKHRAHSRPAGRRPRSRLEGLEPRLPLSADVVISELMAINRTGLTDEDGEHSDWIELHNRGTTAVNLENWSLTDNPLELRKWVFPDVTLDARAYLVVFASGKDRNDAADGPLHTNFKLDGAGEYLALVKPDSQTLTTQFAPFPVQVADVAYGLGASAADSPLLPGDHAWQVHVPTLQSAGALRLDWTSQGFVPGAGDEAWLPAQGLVGYDLDGSFPVPLDSDLSDAIYDVNSGAYLRSTFQVSDPAAIDRLRLDVRYDDAFVAYLNGQEVTSRNIRPRAESPSTGLVSYWSFDGHLRDTAREFAAHIGQADDDLAADDSTPQFEQGHVGAAARLGVEPADPGVLVAPISPDVRLSAVHTIESWIYPTELDESWQRLVLNWSGDYAYQLSIRNSGDSQNALTLFQGQSNGLWVQASGGTVVANQWQHVAGVADGHYLRVYLNGVEVAKERYDGTIQVAQEQGLGVGDSPLPSGLQYNGLVDELAFWNVALSPEQIRSHFEAAGQGYGLVREDDDGMLPWNATAAQLQLDETAVVPEAIDLSGLRNLVRSGENVLAVHLLNASAVDRDLLLGAALSAQQIAVDPASQRYFAAPTPGQPNGIGVAELGPLVMEVGHELLPVGGPAETQSLAVTARVVPAVSPVARVTLHYRVMFGATASLEMFDDGQHADGAAGDGQFGAVTPPGLAAPGQMIRYFVTADDNDGRATRVPAFDDPLGSPEYFGAMLADPTLSTPLDAFHWFVQVPSRAETPEGTRASVYFDGTLYDNVLVRIRGDTARRWPKKSFKFDFNPGYAFRYDPSLPPVEEINLNSSFTDKSYVRSTLSFETLAAAGVPSSQSRFWHVRQNGSFYNLGIFVEQPDEDYLRRNGLDPDGALYKAVANPLAGAATTGIEKKTRELEDWSDMQGLIDGLGLTGNERDKYLFDNLNLAAIVNYMAANVIIQNIDRTVKNYYVYRDTEGTGEWQVLPWDLDLTFGPNRLNTDTIEGADDASPDHTSHPFLGTSAYPYFGLHNRLLTAIVENAQTREMFLRRLRSLMDQLVNHPSTPPDERYFEQRVDELAAEISLDVGRDKTAWGTLNHFGNTNITLAQAIDRLKNEFLTPHRRHLYVDHLAPDGVGIPPAQAVNPSLSFGQIDFNPISGDQDEEYIEIVNENEQAVDISLWQLTGGVRHVFPPGTVVPSHSSLFVAADAAEFRWRDNGPSGRQKRFVQGNYEGRLSNYGETLALLAADGSTVATLTTPVEPTLAQESLRITEIMYHPQDPSPAGAFAAQQYEFIELRNMGHFALELDGIRFTRGVDFDFSKGELESLAPGQRIVVVRNREAFVERYGLLIPIAGEFDSSSLSDDGELVKLEDAGGNTIHSLEYHPSWAASANGGGHSLEIVDSFTPIALWADAASWRASLALGGSPGQSDSPPAAVVAEHIFYNNSAFDGGTPGHDARDDLAIAPDKRSLAPGATATFANYTSFSRGINGILVDLVGMHALPTIDDFSFRAGNSNAPLSWAPVSGATLSTRRGAGVAGSDRLTLIWPDGLIANRWLEVTVKATAYTGLASDFVFYFGNAVGETGDSLSHARVGTADTIGVRQHPHNQLNPAAIDNPYDFNRDRRVSAIDEAFVRLNATSALTALKLIAPPPLVSAPQGDEAALRPRARRRP